MDNLDVLVVYSASVALSASVDDSHSRCPFLLGSKRANYNLSYAYFLEECHRNGIVAGFTSSSDIIGPGMCQTFWKFTLDGWKKINRIAQSNNVFLKLSPGSKNRAKERKLLLSDDSIKPFNDTNLFETFFDKLLTYKTLPNYAIPTVGLSSTDTCDIYQAVNKLHSLVSTQRFPDDFSEKIVIKDRFGAGGNYVYKVESNYVESIQKIMLDNPEVKFVLQPFLSFDKGYLYNDIQAAVDIRLIFLNNKLLQCYIRVAKAGDFRCNEHQGGNLVYVNKNDIPDLIHKISRKLIKKINKSKSLYALDFVISNHGRAYFIEGNMGPGIDWDIKKKINEKMSKQLINSIVAEFTSRIDKSIS